MYDSNFITSKSSDSGSAYLTYEESPISEMLGLAVFNNDKLVGELTALETLCYLIISDKVEDFDIAVPNPDDETTSIVLFAYNRKKPKVKVKLINGSPLIQIDIKLKAKLQNANGNISYMSEEKLEEVSASANKYINNIMSDYLYKTSKELNADIHGFGRYALPLFLTKPDYNKFNWLKNYKNAFFDVNVDTNVESAFILSGK